MDWKLTRIKDYEFLGLWKPSKKEDFGFFYVYFLILEDGVEGKTFLHSHRKSLFFKGDAVEYTLEGDGKLVARTPKKKTSPYENTKVDFNGNN